MRVKNWEQWTKFKKRYILFSFVMGFMLVFGTDAWWGYLGLPLSLSGAWVIGTIQDHEW